MKIKDLTHRLRIDYSLINSISPSLFRKIFNWRERTIYYHRAGAERITRKNIKRISRGKISKIPRSMRFQIEVEGYIETYEEKKKRKFREISNIGTYKNTRKEILMKLKTMEISGKVHLKKVNIISFKQRKLK